MNKMNEETKLDEVLQHIDGLKTFFKFGDEILPFLENLFDFLKNTMPLIQDMNSSLQDSTLKLPTASDRIADVNKATEYATEEILDALDRISLLLESFPKLEQNEQENSIGTMHEEVANIVTSLQFQDVTSQKLEHANKILAAIYEKLNTLVSSFEEAKISTSLSGSLWAGAEAKTDPDARQKEHAEFEEKVKDQIHHETISPDMIDGLLAEARSSSEE